MTRRVVRDRADRGMATVELAASLPVLVLILAVVMGGVSVVNARVRAQDAAAMVARANARGDAAAAQRFFAELAPSGATVEVTNAADEVTAAVRVTVRPVGGWLGGYSVLERAVAAREPEASAAPP